MLPGVTVPDEGLPLLNNGDLVLVCLFQPQVVPLAIGICLMSSKEMQQNEYRGKGVRILHSFMDKLWEMGDKSEPDITLQQPVSERKVDDLVETASQLDLNDSPQKEILLSTSEMDSLLETSFMTCIVKTIIPDK